MLACTSTSTSTTTSKFHFRVLTVYRRALLLQASTLDLLARDLESNQQFRWKLYKDMTEVFGYYQYIS